MGRQGSKFSLQQLVAGTAVASWNSSHRTTVRRSFCASTRAVWPWILRVGDSTNGKTGEDSFHTRSFDLQGVQNAPSPIPSSWRTALHVKFSYLSIQNSHSHKWSEQRQRRETASFLGWLFPFGRGRGRGRRGLPSRALWKAIFVYFAN